MRINYSSAAKGDEKQTDAGGDDDLQGEEVEEWSVRSAPVQRSGSSISQTCGVPRVAGARGVRVLTGLQL